MPSALEALEADGEEGVLVRESHLEAVGLGEEEVVEGACCDGGFRSGELWLKAG